MSFINNFQTSKILTSSWWASPLPLSPSLTENTLFLVKPSTPVLLGRHMWNWIFWAAKINSCKGKWFGSIWFAPVSSRHFFCEKKKTDLCSKTDTCVAENSLCRCYNLHCKWSSSTSYQVTKNVTHHISL